MRIEQRDKDNYALRPEAQEVMDKMNSESHYLLRLYVDDERRLVRVLITLDPNEVEQCVTDMVAYFRDGDGEAFWTDMLPDEYRGAKLCDVLPVDDAFDVRADRAERGAA